MIVEIGHFALILALLVAAVQAVVPAWGAQIGDARLMRLAGPAAVTSLALVFLAFLALTHAYLTSDFSVANVWANSHSAKPLVYRISGVWGNHEGSMLLWVLILAVFGAAVAVFGTYLPERLRANALAVQASIAFAFLLFILATSNPFERLDPAPLEGRGLNPVLQDPALAIHPPFLYMGYVGFSMAFSFAVAALIEGRVDAAWARWVRPWTLAAWMCLTLGIALGSWWAYYELGWGGFWFWDPVENASFMPLLAGTALLHSVLVMEKRDALKVWTILLAILTFSLSLMGTFLVRSGVLSSVHAFAVDPQRGVFILAIMVIFTGGALALFALRAGSLRQGELFRPISREGGIVLNNLVLATATGTVLIGTLYPLALEMVTGAKISVGAPYFNMTFVPIMLPALLAMPFGTLLPWKRGDLVAVSQRLLAAMILALVAAAIAMAAYWRGPWGAPLGIAIGVWVLIGGATELMVKSKLGSASPAEVLRRLFNLPRATWGASLAHVGLGLTVLGIVGTSAWRTEVIAAMRTGDRTEIAGYTLEFRGTSDGNGPNYSELVGHLVVTRGTRAVTDLYPAKRTFPTAPGAPTTEAGIYPAWSGDLYAVLGDAQPDGARAIHVFFNPLVRLIWIGAVVMFLGGGLSLADRRLRVGAPRKARPLPVVPAE